VGKEVSVMKIAIVHRIKKDSAIDLECYYYYLYIFFEREGRREILAVSPSKIIALKP
jgi:hypothetical protein